MATWRSATELLDPKSERAVNGCGGDVRGRRDPVYLFACHLEWRDRGDLRAYQELICALDDHDENVRRLAERLLHRSSPHPNGKLQDREWS
jgi:hypothetical protein